MPSVGIFSRRKASADKALRAALAQQEDSFAHSASSSPVISSPLFTTVPQSAPLLACRKKSIPKRTQPAVSSNAADLVLFAPQPVRAKTLTLNDPSSSPRGSASGGLRPLNRSSSSGPSRRAKLLDQCSPIEGYQEVFPLDSRHSQALQQGLPPPPNSPMLVPLDPGAPRGRAPVSPPVSSQGQQGVYPPAYPVSPPLSPGCLGGCVAGEYGISGQVTVHSRTERDTATDIAELEKAIFLRDNVIAKYAANFDIDEVLGAPPVRSEAQRVNQIISRHIRKLDTSSHGKENSILKESSYLNNSKDHGRASNPQDLENIQLLKQRELELVDTVKGKERELELLRSNSHGYLEQITVMTRVLAQKDEELENARVRIQEVDCNQGWDRNTPTMEGYSETCLADIGRTLMDEIRRRERAEKGLAEALIKSRTDLETVLIEEEKKREEIRTEVRKEFEHTLQNEGKNRDEQQQEAKENLNHILEEEGKQRAELNRIFEEKIEGIELLRRNDQYEFQKNLAGLKDDKARLEKQVRDNAEEFERNRQFANTQRDANEELLEMTKSINIRLGEEKKKNRQLEEKIGQITEDALNNVSGANHKVAMLKNAIEDKDTKIEFFETELMAMKRERKGVEEAWAGLENELEGARKALSDRDEMVKGLQEENSGVVDRLEAYRKELDELKKQIGAEDQRIIPPEIQDMAKTTKLLTQDIELYKMDVKKYIKDVKKRDNHIKVLQKGISELESLLDSKTLETKVLQDALGALGSCREGSPSSNDSSDAESQSASPLRDETAMLRAKLQLYEKEYRIIHEEHEALKKKHDLFISQQAVIITEMDQQLTHARKEKDAIEATAARQLKRMQHGFLQLPQATVSGRLVDAAVAKKYQDIPLPPLPTAQKDAPISSKRPNISLKRGASKIKESRRRHSSLPGLSPIPDPVVEVDRVGVNKAELKVNTGLGKVIQEPDGTSEKKEVIEW